MYKAVKKIVQDKEYYKNTFRVFDCTSHPLNRMKIASNDVLENN